MDRRTSARLMSIGQSIPRDLMKRGLKKERPMKGEYEALEEVARDKRLTLQERRELAKLLEDPTMRKNAERVVESMDPEVNRKIEAHVSGRVANAIRTGKLKPADMREYDAYMKKLHKR